MKFKAFVAVGIAALVLGNAGSSHAQAASGTEPSSVAPWPEGVADTSDTYGASDTSYVVGAYDFDPTTSATTFGHHSPSGARFFTSAGGGFVLAAVHLPNGAVINRIEVQGCDTNAATGLVAGLYSNTITGGTGGLEAQVSHGITITSGTPGCGFFSTNLPPVTVNNQVRSYYIQVNTAAADSSVRYHAVRLFYRLRVSPAPATATFPNDVPTNHPFFPFVEAMAASGLTGGCAAGSFCPDSPVTRGQLAVFLAVALGLHFPN